MPVAAGVPPGVRDSVADELSVAEEVTEPCGVPELVAKPDVDDEGVEPKDRLAVTEAVHVDVCVAVAEGGPAI